MYTLLHFINKSYGYDNNSGSTYLKFVSFTNYDQELYLCPVSIIPFVFQFYQFIDFNFENSLDLDLGGKCNAFSGVGYDFAVELSTVYTLALDSTFALI